MRRNLVLQGALFFRQAGQHLLPQGPQVVLQLFDQLLLAEDGAIRQS